MVTGKPFADKGVIFKSGSQTTIASVGAALAPIHERNRHPSSQHAVKQNRAQADPIS